MGKGKEVPQKQTAIGDQPSPNIQLIVAIIAALGLIIVALINRTTPLIAIHATQTAEALHTSAAVTQNFLMQATGIPATSTKSDITTSIITLSPVSPSETLALQPTVSSALQWCDGFDERNIDLDKWNSPDHQAIIYPENGVLNFIVSEEQTRNDEVNASLDTKQTNPPKPIQEVSYTVTLKSYGINATGSVGIDIFLLGIDPVLSVDIGPDSNNLEGEFSFCPNFDTYYFDCEHPTPYPNGDFIPVTLESPTKVRVVWTGEKVDFYIGDNAIPLASQPVASPIENFLLHVDANQGSTLQATIDNVCVTYTSN
jgi:hypothetical protein